MGSRKEKIRKFIQMEEDDDEWREEARAYLQVYDAKKVKEIRHEN